MARLFAFVLLALTICRAEAASLPVQEFAYGSDAKQMLDVYAPMGVQNAPMIVMVHGGGWRHGDKDYSRVIENKVPHYNAQGYIFVSVNYRLLPDADPLQQAQDVAAAVRYVQANAARFGGDASRVILMGHSAGAHLVVLLASNPARYQLQPVRGTVALDSAGYDIPAVMNGRHLRLYDQAWGKDPSFWQAGSPIHNIVPGGAPLLLVCSTRRDDACPQAKAYAAVAGNKGIKVGVLPVDMRHGPINAELGEASAYTQTVDSFIAEQIR